MAIFAPSIVLLLVVAVPPLFFLLSTPKITQPFSLVGHDICYYHRIAYTILQQTTINADTRSYDNAVHQ
jgi:hypothetical protein